MASNIVPTGSGPLIQLGKEAFAGLTSLGGTLMITILTPAQLQADLNAFIAADNTYNFDRSAQQVASDAFHAADDAIAGWLGDARGVFIQKFGRRWSTEWVQAGFVNNSTAVPKKIEDRLALCARVAAFLGANPSYEVADLKVTAAEGTALENTAQTTNQAWTAAAQTLNTMGITWTTAFNQLTDDLWSLIKVLQATLAADDPRWLAFGLQMPGTISTPGQPVNVTAHADATGSIVVQCDAVPLATRYRWRMLLVGLQPDYLLVAGVKEPMAVIAGVPPGRTAQIIVQAVNNNLQGVASDPIQFTVPVLAAEAALAKPAAAERPAAKSLANGNGHGHGHDRALAARLA